MFRSPDGYLRNTAPGNVSVGYASSAHAAAVADGVFGGKIAVGGGTVYAINGQTIYNGFSRTILAVTRVNIGFGSYFSIATVIGAGSYGSVPNLVDGEDFWFALP